MCVGYLEKRMGFILHRAKLGSLEKYKKYKLYPARLLKFGSEACPTTSPHSYNSKDLHTDDLIHVIKEKKTGGMESVACCRRHLYLMQSTSSPRSTLQPHTWSGYNCLICSHTLFLHPSLTVLCARGGGSLRARVCV